MQTTMQGESPAIRGLSHYGILANTGPMSMSWPSRTGDDYEVKFRREVAVYRTFIDKLYRFGFSIDGQFGIVKIPDFLGTI
jgi:hypothetical protein